MIRACDNTADTDSRIRVHFLQHKHFYLHCCNRKGRFVNSARQRMHCYFRRSLSERRVSFVNKIQFDMNYKFKKSHHSVRRFQRGKTNMALSIKLQLNKSETKFSKTFSQASNFFYIVNTVDTCSCISYSSTLNIRNFNFKLIIQAK